MRILVFGKTGQVGSGLRRDLKGLGRVRFVDRMEVDLVDLAGVENVIQDDKPDIVINAAAYTNVDHAESDEKTAELINAKAPGVMAEMTNANNAWLIHYSTDYVFDGKGSVPYTEDTAKRPTSIYGETKSAGEDAITQATDRYLILRTSWVYSNHGRNFLNTILRLAAANPELRIVDDQTGTPTYAGALSSNTVKLIEKLRSGPHKAGTFNMTCEGATSWYGFACEILSLAGIEGVDIIPIPTSEFPTPAKRPGYSVLDNTKLQKTYGLQLPHWQDSLRECLTRRAFA